MPCVTLNNETVSFDGPTPSSYNTVFELLSTTIEDQDNCITSFIVDGQDILTGNTPSTENFKSIKISTAPQSTTFLKLIDQTLSQNQNLPADLDLFAVNTLHHPLSAIKNNIDNFSDKISPVAYLLELLLNYAQKKNPPWSEKLQTHFNEFQNTISKFADSLDADNIPELSNTIALEMKPSITNTFNFITQTITPFFQSNEPTPSK